MTIEEAASNYARMMCGENGLKPEPNLNEHVPSYMQDAHKAGSKWVLDVLKQRIEEQIRKMDLSGLTTPDEVRGLRQAVQMIEELPEYLARQPKEV